MRKAAADIRRGLDIDMNILLICYESPLNPSNGAALRTHHICRALSSLGTVRPLVMQPSDHTQLLPPQEAQEVGRIRFRIPVVPWATTETRKIRRLVAQAAAAHSFDVVVVRYLPLAMLIEGCLAAPVVVDGDDLDKLDATRAAGPMRRALGGLRTLLLRAITRRAVRRFAHVWYVHPQDMQRFPARSGSLLPNVVDAPESVLASVSAAPVVLMVGRFSYAPNAEGADFFMREVLPALRKAIAGVRFRLVGECRAEQAARWTSVGGVEVAGFVDRLAPEYAAATVVVAPIFSGGGTQIKVLEALAYARSPVVSAFSAAGFSPTLRHGEHVLVARDAAEWTSHCLHLLGSDAERDRLGRAGRAEAIRSYSAASMVREVTSTISRIAAAPVASH